VLSQSLIEELASLLNIHPSEAAGMGEELVDFFSALLEMERNNPAPHPSNGVYNQLE